jgi:cellulose synthase/poly-beta-1,6-N-acetylglucosamine synthase-like glycosyltransferase
MIGLFYCLKKKKIDISVIIPICIFYFHNMVMYAKLHYKQKVNNGKFLSKCLNSVINQSLKTIEIICIDDGSTDNSLLILKKVKDFDKRLIIL